MVAKQTLVGPNTRVVIPDDGRQLEVPMMELDNEDLEQLADTATALLQDRLRKVAS